MVKRPNVQYFDDGSSIETYKYNGGKQTITTAYDQNNQIVGSVEIDKEDDGFKRTISTDSEGIIRDEMITPDWKSVTTKNLDGSGTIVEESNDGVKYVQTLGENGNLLKNEKYLSDGSKIETKFNEDGSKTLEVQYDDGGYNSFTTNNDGTETREYYSPDGKKHSYIKETDGTIYELNEDGSIMHKIDNNPSTITTDSNNLEVQENSTAPQQVEYNEISDLNDPKREIMPKSDFMDAFADSNYNSDDLEKMYEAYKSVGFTNKEIQPTVEQQKAILKALATNNSNFSSTDIVRIFASSDQNSINDLKKTYEAYEETNNSTISSTDMAEIVASSGQYDINDLKNTYEAFDNEGYISTTYEEKKYDPNSSFAKQLNECYELFNNEYYKNNIEELKTEIMDTIYGFYELKNSMDLRGEAAKNLEDIFDHLESNGQKIQDYVETSASNAIDNIEKLKEILNKRKTIQGQLVDANVELEKAEISLKDTPQIIPCTHYHEGTSSYITANGYKHEGSPGYYEHPEGDFNEDYKAAVDQVNICKEKVKDLETKISNLETEASSIINTIKNIDNQTDSLLNISFIDK